MNRERRALTRAGLKATAARERIFPLLESALPERHHLSADDIYARLRQSGERIGISSIYRVLTDLEDAGLVHRHHFDRHTMGRSLFELADGAAHDHMVCVETGRILEFQDPLIEARQRAIAERHGFEVVGRKLVIRVRRARPRGGVSTTA
ncbi:MAG: transcriptional repressor [Alcanivorax sp.]|nr:transcriptional repressor [Alcanivorax sp.]MBI53547.1 transcriptional repressor [Alcanivorax sp.]MBU59268.1 transcriptional repressor [Alcanivorax sp.]HCE38674.1 ferric iron uptake transcriptional regulator [Alcanivorax sp.]|tara:strand:+ start:281 stop:730 length:450 start_codon:yes stop_codon:yes gene_type:complete